MRLFVVRVEINEILEMIKNIREQEEAFTLAPDLNFESLEKYKLLSQYNNILFAFL